MFLKVEESNQAKLQLVKKSQENHRSWKVSINPSISIKNACLVYALKFNLLSISQLCHQGSKVTFNSTQCGVSNLKTENITLPRSRLGNVYAINLNHINSKNLRYFKSINSD